MSLQSFHGHCGVTFVEPERPRIRFVGQIGKKEKAKEGKDDGHDTIDDEQPSVKKEIDMMRGKK